MNTSDALTHLYRHHQWANLRLLEACAALNDDQLQAAIPGSFGSLVETLRHIAMSEQSYFSRIRTGQGYRRPSDAPPMSFPEMAEALKTTGEGLIEWAPKVQAGDTVWVDWEGTPREVPKTVILTQVINHATEHREQIKAMLTMLGIEPPDLQSWAFFDETAG